MEPSVWATSLAAVTVVSLISIIGAFTISMDMKRLLGALRYLIAFAAGAMLGDAFLHLLPESLAEGIEPLNIGIGVLSGLVLFLLLERVVYWRHSHLPTHEHQPHPVGVTNLVGDGLHNFLDGVIIGGSFLVSTPLGIATTLAVILHEIPQEIGDFSVLIHAGYSRNRALLLNLLSAFVAVLGTVVTLLVGGTLTALTDLLVPFTIGGFLYIAAVDLLPEMHRERETRASALQLFSFLGGIGVMALLLLVR